jgi:hypothetical protein
MQVLLKLTDGARQELGRWTVVISPETPNDKLEMSFTGPDGAPWYAELEWKDAVALADDVSAADLQSVSDYDLTTEVYRRMTHGAELVSHEPSDELDG